MLNIFIAQINLAPSLGLEIYVRNYFLQRPIYAQWPCQ